MVALPYKSDMGGRCKLRGEGGGLYEFHNFRNLGLIIFFGVLGDCSILAGISLGFLMFQF